MPRNHQVTSRILFTLSRPIRLSINSRFKTPFFSTRELFNSTRIPENRTALEPLPLSSRFLKQRNFSVNPSKKTGRLGVLLNSLKSYMPNSLQQHTYQIFKFLQKKEGREEIYKFLQALSICIGFLMYINTSKEDRRKRKVELGLAITKELEQAKTDLLCLINELNAMSQPDLQNIDVKKINEYERTFGYSLRMASRYDTSLVPDVLKVEADYQFERLRYLMKCFLSEKSIENTDKLKRCFFDIYNTINLISLIAAANTIEKGKTTEEQNVLLAELKKSGILVNDVRTKVHNHRIETLMELKRKKIRGNHELPLIPDNYVSHHVFGSNSNSDPVPSSTLLAQPSTPTTNNTSFSTKDPDTTPPSWQFPVC